MLACHQDKVAMDLGFYYMANAMGRLVGTLVGGFLYHYTVRSTDCHVLSLYCTWRVFLLR